MKIAGQPIAVLSILAGFATVVTSIKILTLDERIDWGNSSDFKGKLSFDLFVTSKNETTNSPILEFKVLQDVFSSL